MLVNTEEFMNLSMNDKVRTVNNILEKDYLDELKRQLHNHQNQLIMDPLVYNPNSKTINKSFQVNADIYDILRVMCYTVSTSPSKGYFQYESLGIY